MPESKIRIRMYRVGFGDCFLVTFPGRSPAHVLVDCGVHTSGDIATLQLAVENIAKQTNRKLALLIATHAHEDHIAGFARHAEIFKDFRIGEVWLPWSENLKDKLARRMRKKLTAIQTRLHAHFAARPPSPAAAAALANGTAKRNAEALQNLRTGFGTGAEVQYLEAGMVLKQAAGIPGLTAQILGPPRDEAFLKKMDPPKAERYFRPGASGNEEPANAVFPFGPRQVRGADDPGPLLTDAEKIAFRKGAETDFEALAFKLDDALNNSSIATVFTFRGAHLLFPGDAQWGNWKYWVEAEGGEDLLSDIHFYKVSHHGSENATPKSALEGMPEGFCAMCSTQSKPWPSIPYPKLWDRMETRTKNRIVRSDSLPWPVGPEGPEMRRLPTGFKRGKFWIDCMISPRGR
jgi:hypothetical protein